MKVSKQVIYLRERSKPPVKIETLAEHVKALGGKLEVTAVFRDKKIQLG